MLYTCQFPVRSFVVSDIFPSNVFEIILNSFQTRYSSESFHLSNYSYCYYGSIFLGCFGGIINYKIIQLIVPQIND